MPLTFHAHSSMTGPALYRLISTVLFPSPVCQDCLVREGPGPRIFSGEMPISCGSPLQQQVSRSEPSYRAATAGSLNP